MELGYTVWNWMRYDFSRDINKKDWQSWSEHPKRDFEIACKTMSDIGFYNVECFNFITEYYDGADDEFDALMKKYKLTFSCIYNYLTNDFEKDVKVTERCIEFMKRHGTKGKMYMNLESPKRPTDRKVTENDYKLASEQANVLGKMCAEAGIKLTLHPHYGTVIERQEEIDYFASHTDPKYVWFCLDTAHTTINGMRPEELFVQYADRLGYVHLKDVQPDPDHEYTLPTAQFRALGQGTVDFVTIVKYIKQKGFDGILCVELDNPIVNHYESAEYSKKYLHSVVGID
ncbi:MAG: sugar phosphate isomerase/epimerase [Oscillospiraceae bacterium]